MTKAKVFRSGNSQAVQLPKEFRVSSDQVEIFRRGDEIVLRERPRTLATAFELTLKNVPYVLLEASGRPGGVVLSEEIDGYTIDGGPDALLAQKHAGIALCEEVGLRDRLINTKPPRFAFIQRGGQL